MNSGKTTALLQVAYNYEERGMKVVIMKPSADTKGNMKIVSRLGLERNVDVLVTPKASILQLLETMRGIACVLIDEAQFLTPAQVDELFWFASDKDIPVMAYGLRTDFQTKGFPGSTRLLELAHDLQEIKTICRCGKKAVFNGRKVNGKFTSRGLQVAIEGKDDVDYESLCASCYKKLVST
jgi:thymidine kinase